MDIEHFKARLISRREELQESIEMAQGAADTVELDQTRQGRLSRMDAMQQQAMSSAAQQRRGLELKQISAALNRIEKCEYGECTECGDEIPAGRLDIDPTAKHCIHCAEKMERR
ncbi:MAG: TraR/DksA family transcriptional regulator [Gammaproteobacteria bacterium]|nr:TraR/DksA family transcriptional regulator [Gammaproteobacteria bacterium]